MARARIFSMILLLLVSHAACGDHAGAGGRGGAGGGGQGGAEVDGGASAVGGQASIEVGGNIGGTVADAVVGTGGMGGGAVGDAGETGDAVVVGTGGIGGGAVGGGGGIDAGGVAGQVGGEVGAGGAVLVDASVGSEGGGGAFDAGTEDAVKASDGQMPTGPPDYLIIAADNLGASAARYRDFRRAGGFAVELALVGDLVGDAPDASAASARIIDFVRTRYLARDGGRPMVLLLLGDAQATWPGDHTGVPAGSWQDPSGAASVVSDNVYADMDGDDVPEIAVGRITADSDAELDLVRAKVAAYETTREIGVWDRRLNIFASTSGMGSLVDTAIETVVYAITEAIPYDYDITMTYARRDSYYVYIPEQFSDQVYRRINEGSLLVAYVGHGYRDGFATLDWNGTSYPILDTSHLENLAVAHKAPILLFVACSTGAFAGSESVSEKILARADAPTAILSSTEVSDPYANAIFIYEASQAFTASRAATVGDAFLLAKRRVMGNTDSVRQVIESLGGLFASASAREALKHSHLHMYTLFGDPGMAVVYPGSAEVAVTPTSASAGADLTVSATFPALADAGEAIVTLESTRQEIPGTTTKLPADGDPTRDAVIVKNYQTANDKVVAGLTMPVSGSSLSAIVKVPATLLAGQYHVKVFVRDNSSDYAGSAALTVVK